jgi:hypothetical protein
MKLALRAGLGLVVLAMLTGCGESFKSDIALDSVIKSNTFDSKLTIDISGSDSGIEPDMSRATVRGGCHASTYQSHVITWELRNNQNLYQGAEPSLCQGNRFELPLRLDDKNIQSGVLSLTVKIIATDASGKSFESAADSAEYTVTGGGGSSGGGGGSGGGTGGGSGGGGGGPGGCADQKTENFCRGGGFPPNQLALIEELGRRYSAELSRCDRKSDEFIKIVIRELRKIDTNWGSNWVRGNIGDSNGDVISYYYGPGAPQENSPFNSIVDVIGNCGAPNPNIYWGADGLSYHECCNPNGSSKWTIAPLR